ncbi:MAG: hypothetical protein EOP50_07220 [Sphingobacteriales bacterium]|nr:MAG: hypothetical protein EOP50_07220 [Sphingobacteriales bacterium]
MLQAAKTLSANGNTVVAVLHDINLALRYADRLLFLKEGALRYKLDHPRELTPQMIEDVFGIGCSLLPMEDGLPLVVFS